MTWTFGALTRSRKLEDRPAQVSSSQTHKVFEASLSHQAAESRSLQIQEIREAGPNSRTLGHHTVHPFAGRRASHQVLPDTKVEGIVEEDGEWLRINDKVFLPMKACVACRSVLVDAPIEETNSQFM